MIHIHDFLLEKHDKILYVCSVKYRWIRADRNLQDPKGPRSKKDFSATIDDREV